MADRSLMTVLTGGNEIQCNCAMMLEKRVARVDPSDVILGGNCGVHDAQRHASTLPQAGTVGHVEEAGERLISFVRFDDGL